MRKLAILAASCILGIGTYVYAQNNQQIAPVGNASIAAAFSDPANVPTDLARIDRALNDTLSFSGRFSQYGADGSFSQGKIYLKRPGKLRFEYDPPATLVVVSDGTTLTEHDRALQTMDRVPLASTPLNYFLKEDVKLERDTEITGLRKTLSDISLTARDGSGKVDGEITMVFDAQNLVLKEWLIRSSFGGGTRVVLSDLRYNERINPRLFTLRDERREKRRRE